MTKGKSEKQKPPSVCVKEEEPGSVLKSTELSEEDEEPEGGSKIQTPYLVNNSDKENHPEEDAENPALPIGFTVSDYRIEEHLGSGGMGEVYRAVHTKQEKVYALKVLRKELLRDKSSKKRFEMEAKTCRNLNSPYIVSTYESGITRDGLPYIVMELAEGESLAKILRRRGSLEKEEFIEIFAQVSEALGYAHGNRILHRDLKPSNIIISRDEKGNYVAKLADFGISRILHESDKEEQQVTKTGELIGSPIYMSPEQCTSASYDQRSDIYSLGVVMYEAITGDPPFVGNNAVSTIMKHVSSAVTPINEPGTTEESKILIEQIILKCLEKDPTRRYGNATEIGIDLESISCDPENYDKQKLLSKCRKARLRRYLDQNGRVMFLSLFATLAISILIYQIKDQNYKEALFRSLVSRAGISNSYGGHTYVHNSYKLWIKAYNLAEKLGKNNLIKAKIMEKAGQSNFGPEDTFEVLYRGTRGTEELEKAYELIKHRSDCNVEKLNIMRKLADLYAASANSIFGESAYYPVKMQDEARAIVEQIQNRYENEDYRGAEQLVLTAYNKGAREPHQIRLFGNVYAELAHREKEPQKRISLFEKSINFTNCDDHRKSRWFDLAESIKEVGLNPLSASDRFRLGKEAEGRGDLRSAALEYHASMALKQDPEAEIALHNVQRKLSKTLFRKQERIAYRTVPFFKKYFKQSRKVFDFSSRGEMKGKKQLANMYKNLGEYDKAVKLYKSLFDGHLVDRNHYMILDNDFTRYVECLYLTGDLNKALKVIQIWEEEVNRGLAPAFSDEEIALVRSIKANCYLLRGKPDLYDIEIASKLRSVEVYQPDAFTVLPAPSHDFNSSTGF